MDKRFTPAVIAAAQAGQSAYKVPTSVTLAQWALESAYGAHMPLGSNNPFGIKARVGEPFVPATTWEVVKGQRVNVVQNFRKFTSLAEAFEAHARLLATSKYYTKAMTKTGDPQAFAIALTGVYATDPGYGPKLISIMKANDLFALDKAPLAQPVASAPAAAVPAQPPAAKEPTMTDTSALAQAHPNAAKASSGVDLFQGVVNIGNHIAEMLGAGANAIQSVKLPDITGAPGSHNFFGTFSNVQKAAAKVGEIVSDAKNGAVREGVADGADLLKLIFATLDIYKIDVPVLSTVIASLPSLHADGADKPA